MGVEEEIDSMLKVMEEQVRKEKLLPNKIGHNKEYIPCKKKIDSYEGVREKEFIRRLNCLIKYIDFHN